MSISTTEGKMYLVNIQDPRQKVEIQFFPRDLPFDRAIKSNDIDIIGRNNPLAHHTGGATTFTLNLDFYAEEENLEDVMRRVTMIESWTYNEGFDEGVPPIKVVWGSLFKSQDAWVIKKCSYRFEQFDKQRGFLPRQAYMDLTLSLDTPTNVKASERRRIWG